MYLCSTISQAPGSSDESFNPPIYWQLLSTTRSGKNECMFWLFVILNDLTTTLVMIMATILIKWPIIQARKAALKLLQAATGGWFASSSWAMMMYADKLRSTPQNFKFHTAKHHSRIPLQHNDIAGLWCFIINDKYWVNKRAICYFMMISLYKCGCNWQQRRIMESDRSVQIALVSFIIAGSTVYGMIWLTREKTGSYTWLRENGPIMIAHAMPRRATI